jgi:hypothetical protein
MSKTLKPGIAAAILLVALPLALASGRADAGHRLLAGRRGAWTGTASSYHNGGGNRGGTVTATRPNGKTATASYSRSVSNGTISATHSVTGFNGATRSATSTRTPGEGSTVSYTGHDGRTYSAATTHYNNGGGNLGRTTTLTGPNGRTATRTVSQSVSGATTTISRSATGANGATRSEVVTKTPGEGRTATYTGRGGRTYTTAAGAAGGDQQ